MVQHHHGHDTLCHFMFMKCFSACCLLLLELAVADSILSFFQYDTVVCLHNTSGSELLKMVLLLDFKVRCGMNIFYTDLCQDLAFLAFSALNQTEF